MNCPKCKGTAWRGTTDWYCDAKDCNVISFGEGDVK